MLPVMTGFDVPRISFLGVFRRGGQPPGAYLASVVGVTGRFSQHVEDGVLPAPTFGLAVGDGGVVRTVLRAASFADAVLALIEERLGEHQCRSRPTSSVLPRRWLCVPLPA